MYMLLCERSAWLHYSPFCQIKGVVLYIFDYSVKDFNLYASIICTFIQQGGGNVTVQTFRGKITSKHLYAGQASDEYQGGGGRGGVRFSVWLIYHLYIYWHILKCLHALLSWFNVSAKLQIPSRNRGVALDYVQLPAPRPYYELQWTSTKSAVRLAIRCWRSRWSARPVVDCPGKCKPHIQGVSRLINGARVRLLRKLIRAASVFFFITKNKFVFRHYPFINLL